MVSRYEGDLDCKSSVRKKKHSLGLIPKHGTIFYKILCNSMVECCTVNAKVSGSTPLGGANLKENPPFQVGFPHFTIYKLLIIDDI